MNVNLCINTLNISTPSYFQYIDFFYQVDLCFSLLKFLPNYWKKLHYISRFVFGFSEKACFSNGTIQVLI